MSHDIDMSTGKPAIAYVGETPWHKLGEKLPAGQSIETWTKAARLDWELKRLPAQYLVDGRLRTVDDRFALVRSDTNAALSIVSADYHIVQPKEILEFYRDLVAVHGYTLETAGALNGGRKVWALARTGRSGSADKSDSKDQLAAYVLLATSCDKTLATTAAFTSVRVVCQNTLFFALDDVKERKRPQIRIPHTRRFDPASIKTGLGLIDEAWTSFIEKIRKMAAYKMPAGEEKVFFAEVLGKTPDKELRPKAIRDLESLTALFGSAPGNDLPTTKGTLWGAVNAVSYYTDHVKTSASGDRLDSAWFGTGAQLKDKAWMAASQLLTKS